MVLSLGLEGVSFVLLSVSKTLRHPQTRELDALLPWGDWEGRLDSLEGGLAYIRHEVAKMYKCGDKGQPCLIPIFCFRSSLIPSEILIRFWVIVNDAYQRYQFGGSTHFT